MSITLIIIIITVLISISAFSNDKINNDLIFYPPAVTYQKQWYRFFSCGLIHADWMHLGFNMLALYSFGEATERFFTNSMFHEKGKLFYLLMYITALGVCLLPTYAKHKDDSSYRSLGASGAVSAVIFAYILIDPMADLRFFFLPIPMPAFVFGFIYLGVTSYLDKRGGGNINHSAHLWGSLYGIAFLIVMGAIFSDYPVLAMFIESVKNWRPF
ncbi:rhomboid family intramembrane serine protease [Paraflavitalea sp. CAU 1676]|uniref:rhomboid family intramembrane serine protease n=1 Tax=Paraflavitalea sp. CAU 1676 TaxID=3032598 RepID=UPI0023DB3818|nr:rhomboid family intramembrane serine protease [Paraflavitalea sp. CAU 1676]MDF2191424.1 rhomboid family intramembrane serine protease [Paraflavitalea sp. CAU 1676]